MLILGAGLSGCLAGVLNQEAIIFEAGSNNTTHQAVLRFRSPTISEAVGIPFKQVQVYKDIYMNGSFVAPDIRLMNYYSKKVTNGSFLDRSIADLTTEYRWIAPDKFHDMLKEMCKGRIFYDKHIIDRTQLSDHHHIISTIPINILASIYEIPFITINKDINSIYVTKIMMKETDLQQTIYFPDPDLDIYRATMTGNILRIESMMSITTADEEYVLQAFGMIKSDIDSYVVNSHHQPFGKLKPIDNKQRKNFIRKMSRDHNVYSLGRFATWRNILLDNVLEDIYHIKRFMTQDEYDFSKESI